MFLASCFDANTNLKSKTGVEESHNNEGDTPPPDEVDLNEHSFVGQWKGACYTYNDSENTHVLNFQIVNANMHYGEASSITIDFHAPLGNLPGTDDCTGPALFSVRAKFNIIKADGSPTVTKGTGENVDIDIISVELSPNSTLLALDFDLNSECGLTDWDKDVYQNVSGRTCGETHGADLVMPPANQVFHYLLSLFKTATSPVVTQAFLSWCSTGQCNENTDSRPTDIAAWGFCVVKDNTSDSGLYCNMD